MPWAEYKLAREAVYNETIDAVTQRLNARPPGPRNEANDNSIFQPLRDSTVEALKTGDLSLAVRMFRECIRLTRHYEDNNNCEIHKGAPTFNVGIAHLRSYDFTAALHYFELAQKETRQTSGKANWNIFLDPLFDSSFWDAIEGAANTYPVLLFQQFWNRPLNGINAKAIWMQISGHSKLLLISCLARHVRYRQLVDQSDWNGSSAFALGYWNLIADLCRLIETEAKRRNQSTTAFKTLGQLLAGGFHITRHGNLSRDVARLSSHHAVNTASRYNRKFNVLRNAIQNQASPLADRIGNALYLLQATRNQVAHSVDKKMVLFTDPIAAQFVVEVLFTLCRVNSWTR